MVVKLSIFPLPTACNTILFFLCLNLPGVLLMAASETEDSDILWCINHDSFPFKKPLMETQVGTYGNLVR